MAGAGGQRDATYKAAEVCRMADVQPYVLRYWESEFPFLAANRNASGPRNYTETDLQLVRRIKQLLYDEGYTIAGAKKRLEVELKKGVPLFDDTELAPPDVSDVPPPADEPSEEAAPSPAATRAKRKSKETSPPAVTQSAPEASEAPAAPQAPAPGADPRMAKVVAELKLILSILSSE